MAAAGAGGDGWGSDTAAGINAVEGYLLWQAETSRAQERARGFVAALPWLTTAQREEIERVYVRDHLDHAEAALRATAERCARLRDEYRHVYLVLRRRLTGIFLLAVSLVMGLAALILVFG